jgi:hypothetical protein
MDEMTEWFELNYDADEVVDVLQIEVEELVEAFYDRAKAHYDGHKEATGG